MRTLSVTELAVQDQVRADQREAFKIKNTSPFATYEWDTNVPVHSIRYGGSFDGPNRWGL